MSSVPLKRWLVASLLVNVFVVGGVAGGAARWWMAERGGASAEPPRGGLRHAADDLPAEQRRTFQLAMRNARRAAAEPLQVARESRQEVLRLMRAPQFEAGAVAATLARTRVADMAARERYEATVVEFAATLSADERQKLADGLARRNAQTVSGAASSSKP